LHSNTLDVRLSQICDTDCFQAIAVVWERLSVSKREKVKYVTERFDMKELNDFEVKIVSV
jgi:hypothetical protein